MRRDQRPDGSRLCGVEAQTHTHPRGVQQDGAEARQAQRQQRQGAVCYMGLPHALQQGAARFCKNPGITAAARAR